MKRTLCVLIFLSLLIVPAFADSIPPDENSTGDYEISASTEASGRKPIWVLREFADVPVDHWFYPALQEYRREGIITGDECGRVYLDRPITEEELHTMLIRYIYASDYEGKEINGAIYGDYTYNRHRAWIDAHEEVHTQMEATIAALGKPVELPEGREAQISRKQSFVFFAIAELSRCEDPAWYFNQFSDEHLGYFARSNAPIYVYGTGQPVAGFFSASDHLHMSPLEIQAANMLMYLGVLDGTEDHTLEPNRIIMRGEGVKLLEGIDNLDASPHVHDTDNGDDGDWGGGAGEYPEPEPKGEPVPIIFVDWDNEQIGTLVSYTNSDIRRQVNDYVAANLVHPDLAGANPCSLAREDNYRGQYSEIPVNGEDYPLTNHIDYAFVQQPFRKEGDRYVQTAGKVDYPWAYGWVACTIDNYQDVWTTLGVGELSGWDGGSFPLGYLAIADLEKGVQPDRRGTVVLKALYQPGPDLVVDGNYTPTTEEPYYTAQHEYKAKITPKMQEEAQPYAVAQDATVDEEVVGIMSANVPFYFNWTWSRVTYIDGKPYGVSRIREPHGKVSWEWFGAEFWPCEPDPNLVYSPETAGQVSLLHGWSDEWLYIKNSPDNLNLHPGSTMCFGMDAVLVDGYQSDWYAGTVRSALMRSQAAHSREAQYETEDSGAVYWSPRKGYYSIKTDVEPWDSMVARLCERIGKEGCYRCEAYKQFDPELGSTPEKEGKDSYLANVQYMLVHDVLRLPKTLSSEYWETHTFTNRNMDAFTTCIHDLEDWITANYPDVNDDEWWCDTWNRYYPFYDNSGWPKDVNHTIKYRIPRISYHQLCLYWDEYYDWYFDGQDEATKPTPLSADAADAIPLDYCTLKDHEGFCPGVKNVAEPALIYEFDELVKEVTELGEEAR